MKFANKSTDIAKNKKTLGKWAEHYSSMCCLVINQQDKEIRIVKFLKANKKSKGLDDLIRYTHTMSLFKRRSTQFDIEEVSYLFKILLKIIYKQLQTLGLIPNKNVANIKKK